METQTHQEQRPTKRPEPTHYVCFDYPKERRCMVVRSDAVPCIGAGLAAEIQGRKKDAGMKRVVVLAKAEYDARNR